MSEMALSDYLESNPRMIGVLFTMIVLLTQAGNASAAIGCTIAGP